MPKNTKNDGTKYFGSEKERKINDKIRQLTRDIGRVIKKLKRKYRATFRGRKGKDGQKKTLEEWVPYNEKRKRCRPVTRWRDDFNEELGALWRRVTANKKISKKMGRSTP